MSLAQHQHEELVNRIATALHPLCPGPGGLCDKQWGGHHEDARRMLAVLIHPAPDMKGWPTGRGILDRLQLDERSHDETTGEGHHWWRCLPWEAAAEAAWRYDQMRERFLPEGD